jgi:hypothetical protein
MNYFLTSATFISPEALIHRGDECIVESSGLHHRSSGQDRTGRRPPLHTKPANSVGTVCGCGLQKSLRQNGAAMNDD